MSPSPPNFRRQDGDGRTAFLERCRTCVHERSFGGGRLVCLRYLLWVRTNTVCDDWKGDQPVMDPQNPAQIAMYTHESWPTPEEKKLLEEAELAEGQV